MERKLERAHGLVFHGGYLVLHGVPVDLVHDVGRRPSTAGHYVGVRDPLGVEIGGAVVPEAVEAVGRIDTEDDLLLLEFAGELMRSERRDISLAPDQLDDGVWQQDDPVRSLRLRVLDHVGAVFIHDLVFGDDHIVSVKILQSERADLAAAQAAKGSEQDRDFKLRVFEDLQEPEDFQIGGRLDLLLLTGRERDIEPASYGGLDQSEIVLRGLLAERIDDALNVAVCEGHYALLAERRVLLAQGAFNAPVASHSGRRERFGTFVDITGNRIYKGRIGYILLDLLRKGSGHSDGSLLVRVSETVRLPADRDAHIPVTATEFSCFHKNNLLKGIENKSPGGYTVFVLMAEAPGPMSMIARLVGSRTGDFYYLSNNFAILSNCRIIMKFCSMIVLW